MKNPLLQPEIKFSKVKPQHIEPALDRILKDNRAELKKLLAQESFDWDNLMQPLEEMGEHLHVMWATVEHLNAILNTPKLRKAYNACLPKLAKYSTEMGQNTKLYQAIKSLAKGKNYRKLDIAQKKIITNDLRDFKLAGVTLKPKAKQQLAKLQQKLAQLTSKFSENVLDATNAWSKLITKKSELKGLPKHELDLAAAMPAQRKLKGWLLTLEQPSFQAIMTYAANRDLRQEVYTAYVTRASDQGPNANKWDNSKIMENILKARLKLIKLLKFKNYATYSLAPKTARSTKQVLKFLTKLAQRSKKKAQTEIDQLQEFAKPDNIDKLQPWDLGYYSEKLRQQNFNISQEELKPYFPEPQVLTGMFNLVNKLFDITITEVKDVDTWGNYVKVFDVYDNDQNLRSRFYLDLYARPNKLGGAWMTDYRSRRILPNGDKQIPIAFITCNFSPPVGKTPSLLTHYEVTTLFHEFGHALQHMLTTVDYADVAGVNGVPWDTVELASQFMENWCWQKPILNRITKHYKTGKTLPHKLFKNMIAAKNFQSGIQMLRQLEFALFDFRLHIEFNPTQKNQIQTTLDEVRSKISVTPNVDFNRFQHGFAHIFVGPYAAGYYSYKWAEVLASDAFAKFEEDGIFNKQTGTSYLQNILEPGGSVDPIVLFKRFRGRAPKIDALLKHNGIT